MSRIVDRPPDDTIDGITARDHQCPCGAWWANSVRRDSNTPTQ